MDNKNNYFVIFPAISILTIVVSWPDIFWFSIPSFFICVFTGLLLLEIGFFIFKSLFKGFLWGVFAIYIFGMLGVYKYTHLDEPLKIFDFLVVFDVNNWGNGLIEWKAILLLGCFIGFFLLSALLFFWTTIKCSMERKWYSLGRVVSVVVIFFAMVSFISGFHKFHLFESVSQGYVPYFVYSAFQNSSDPEIKGNSKRFKDLFDKSKSAVAHPEKKKPDIIVWLHEATVNPDIFCEYSAFKKLSLFKENQYSKELGWLRVHTYGGGTWLSEFAFLAGLSSYDFGAQRQAVYYVVTPRLQDSFVKNLKASGYHTIALVPQERKSFYNAESAYRDFGFDEVLSVYDLNMGGPDMWRNSDEMIKKSIVKLWEKHAHHPTFIFTLSVAQHSPFHSTYPPEKWSATLDESKGVLDVDLKARMQDYWSRLPTLSQAMAELEQTVLEQKQRNVILASFGDHHPDFDFDRPGEKRAWLRPYCGIAKQTEPRYLTYFKVQDNFSAQRIEKEAIFHADHAEDLSFLGGKLLTRAGLKASPFFKANQLMHQLCQGRLNDCPDQSLVESYKSYVYNDLQILSKN